MSRFLLLRSSECNGGSASSCVHALQRDGSDLVVQGLEALGAAVLGGELENIGHVVLLVGLDIAGDDDILAVGQTGLASQVLALVLRACLVQVQLGDGRTGGVVNGVLCALSSLRRCCLRRCCNGGSGLRRGSAGSGSGSGATAGGQSNSQCQNGRGGTGLVQFRKNVLLDF